MVVVCDCADRDISAVEVVFLRQYGGEQAADPFPTSHLHEVRGQPSRISIEALPKLVSHQQKLKHSTTPFT